MSATICTTWYGSGMHITYWKHIQKSQWECMFAITLYFYLIYFPSIIIVNLWSSLVYWFSEICSCLHFPPRFRCLIWSRRWLSRPSSPLSSTLLILLFIPKQFRFSTYLFFCLPFITFLVFSFIRLFC